MHTGTVDPARGDLLADLLSRKGTLVADGGMGTSLFAMGLRPGGTPELWNREHPEHIAAVHQGFVDAGADIILTNTFGGTRSRLDLDRLGQRVAELNEAGAGVARQVADASGRTVVVGGSVGPTGALFEPLGPLTHDYAVEIFDEQIRALAGAGCDVIWIETMSSLEELGAAVTAAASRGLPIITTMSFDTNGSTMMGVSPTALARWIGHAPAPLAVVGANCGIGPSDAVVAAAEIRTANPDAVVVVKSNCGIPEVIDGTMWYPAATEDMSAYARLALDAGARIIGACCGSTPQHIAQIREVADHYVPAPGLAVDAVEAQLGKVSRPVSRAGRRRRRAG